MRRSMVRRARLVLKLLALTAVARPADAALLGEWSPTFQLPIIPIAVAMLPTGNIVMWSSNATLTFEGDIGTDPSMTLTALLNPQTPSVTKVYSAHIQADMFCPGIAVLSDGRVIVDGGSSSSHTGLYNPLTGSHGMWNNGVPLNIARGYNTDVTLSNGNVFTIGGSWAGAPGSKDGELWSATDGWQLTGISGNTVLGPDLIDQAQGFVQFGDDHPWLFAMPNGRVFHAGPANQMHFFDPATGTVAAAGTRGTDPFSINGVAVMYAPGKIFKAGGAPAYTSAINDPVLGTITIMASAAAYIIDITQDYTDPTALPVVTHVADIGHARAFANGVVLPDGEVFVVGGQSQPLSFSDANSVMVPEIWNPVTQKAADVATMPTPRNYHSTALLLPDGRVFVGGGGQCGDCDMNMMADPTANHLNNEFYSPPYLFAAEGVLAARPMIARAPTNLTLGDSLAVSASATVTGFSLIRLGSATHTIDTDQRRIPLTIASSAGGLFVLTVPSDPGITVPGYWMLFALDAHNVPSIASIIHVVKP